MIRFEFKRFLGEVHNLDIVDYKKLSQDTREALKSEYKEQVELFKDDQGNIVTIGMVNKILSNDYLYNMEVK